MHVDAAALDACAAHASLAQHCNAYSLVMGDVGQPEHGTHGHAPVADTCSVDLVECTQRIQRCLPIIAHGLDNLRALPHLPISGIAGIGYRPTRPMHRAVDGGGIPAVVASQEPAQHYHTLIALVSTAPMSHEHQRPRSRRCRGIPHHARNSLPLALDGKGPLTDPTAAYDVFGPVEMCHVSLSSCLVLRTAN